MSLTDYRKEQAAAKILEFVQAYELFVVRYAEIASSYPEAAEELKKNIPGLTEIEKAGEELLKKVTKK